LHVRSVVASAFCVLDRYASERFGRLRPTRGEGASGVSTSPSFWMLRHWRCHICMRAVWYTVGYECADGLHHVWQLSTCQYVVYMGCTIPMASLLVLVDAMFGAHVLHPLGPNILLICPGALVCAGDGGCAFPQH
jgi:hypothetical protein